MSAEHIWNDLRSQRERPLFRRVNDAHPHDVYLGIDVKEAPVLMLLSSKSAQEVPQLKVVEISQNLRNDGRFALIVSLVNGELLHPFRYVCDDLIESLRSFTIRGGEATFLLHRLEKWRRLLEPSKRGLSKPELFGLVGELLFLEKLIQKIGALPAIEAWLGPSGAPQDFQNGAQVYEIKACQIAAHMITISSLEQLHTGSTPTNLIVFFLGTCTGNESGAFTPNELIKRLRALLDGSAANSAFELKLAETGFDENQAESNSPMLVDKIRAFDVRDSFPRLTRASVPSAIPSASYSLDLDQCAEFEIPITRVLRYES